MTSATWSTARARPSRTWRSRATCGTRNGAARYLSRWFGPEVTEPIRLHVPAKRYLVATDPAYGTLLSPESARSLELQGGAMDAGEAEAFRRQPYAAEAVALRRWDDLAKAPDAATPPLQHFRSAVEACL